MAIDPKRWNVAMDMVINDMLDTAGVIRPDKDGCCIEVTVIDMDWLTGKPLPKHGRLVYAKCYTCGAVDPHRMLGAASEAEAKEALTMLRKYECVMNWKEDWYG